MKLYIYEGPGHYIGSVIIVASDNYETAYNIISKRLDEMQLYKENISIVEKDINNGIIYSNSGDY
jgi:hypothetical protein